MRLTSIAAAACLVAVLAACSGKSSGGSTPGGGESSSGPPPTTAPGPTPGPKVSAIAGVKPPVSQSQISSLFGASLPGPRAATNGQPTFLYGDVTSTTGPAPHLVVSVSIYTPQLLAHRGTTPAEFYSQGEDPTAEHVSGIGKKAYLVLDQITVLTNHNDVLIVAANQRVEESQLKKAAQQAASKL